MNSHERVLAGEIDEFSFIILAAARQIGTRDYKKYERERKRRECLSLISSFKNGGGFLVPKLCLGTDVAKLCFAGDFWNR
ncbi:MAG TPA: hypothetical protein VMF69_07885 [Gemmataceae bacterium]|nr:hypothetical protein [Gemmataceae bacterium]